MIGEYDLQGVYVSSLVIYALVALLLTTIIRRLLARTRFYALVWHPALFDFALFVIVWGAVTAILTGMITGDPTRIATR